MDDAKEHIEQDVLSDVVDLMDEYVLKKEYIARFKLKKKWNSSVTFDAHVVLYKIALVLLALLTVGRKNKNKNLLHFRHHFQNLIFRGCKVGQLRSFVRTAMDRFVQLFNENYDDDEMLKQFIQFIQEEIDQDMDMPPEFPPGVISVLKRMDWAMIWLLETGIEENNPDVLSRFSMMWMTDYMRICKVLKEEYAPETEVRGMSDVGDAKSYLKDCKSWNELSDQAKEPIFKAIDELKPSSPEEFDRMIMIGDCPRCGSENTKDCEMIVDIEDNTIGVCLDCRYVWCLECGYELKGKRCPHWSACAECDQRDSEELCSAHFETSECTIIHDFMGSNYTEEKGEWVVPFEIKVEKAATCGFCNLIIKEEDELHTIGVKAEKTGDLKKYEGQIIELSFHNVLIPVIVPAFNSEAQKEGIDFLVCACSDLCAQKLKKLLR